MFCYAFWGNMIIFDYKLLDFLEVARFQTYEKSQKAFDADFVKKDLYEEETVARHDNLTLKDL